MPDAHPSILNVFCAATEERTPSPPPAITAPLPGAVHVWFATLDQLRTRAVYWAELLDPVEQERAKRFRFDADRERFILGHGLLRHLLGAYLQRDGSLVRLARGPFGKPYLERKELRFSFSDTKDAILVAFAHANEIGADVETMHRSVDHAAVSQHYFTPTEVATIDQAGRDGLAEDGKRRFLEFWTRKEAVLKASGVGIMDDLKALRVDAPHNTMMITHEAFRSMAAAQYHVTTFLLGEAHLASLAVPAPVDELVVWDAGRLR